MERALAEYVVNALWQLPVLAAGAWLFIRLVRPSPRTQHGIWLAILALAVLLPSYGLSKAEVDRAQAFATVTQESTAIAQEPLTFFPRTRDVKLSATVSRWLVRIYLATVVLALLRIARAWHAAHSLAGHAREIFRNRAELAGLSSRFAVRLPQLRESEEVSSPMVVGVVAPIVLLPEGFDQFTQQEVRAALCHELAHVKRRDYLMNLVCQLVASPLAWHPVLHQVQQRIRITREMVCDAMAAQEMESDIGYARCLLALANSMLGGTDNVGRAELLGLFSKNTLEERVMRLMETTRMSMRARVARVATGAAVMIATGSLAVIFHVTPTRAAQTNGAPPPTIVMATGQTQPEVEKPPSPAAPAAHKPAPARHATPAGKEEQQVEAVKRMAKADDVLDSPEFNQQMEEAQRQMAKASEVFNSPEFKQQMENAQRQIVAANRILDDPEFKKRMEDAQRQIAKAAEVFNSPEFKARIQDEVKRQIEQEGRPSSARETAPPQ